MNAFTTKFNSYCNAHKYRVLTILAVFNGILLFTAQQSKVQLFGKVEAMQHRWTTYTQINKDRLETRIHYSSLEGPETEYHAIDYKYEYSKSKGNEYIVLGYEEPVTIRHNRVFYLDEQCSLAFFGQAKRTLKNMSFRCFY